MIGTFDSQVIEKFKEFQEKTGKYTDLVIEDVQFEESFPFNDDENVILVGSKNIASHEELAQINDKNALPVYDASSNINTYVNENKFPNQVFEVENNSNPDISFASEGNSSAGTNFIIHQNKYFVNNHRTVMKFTNKYYSKYIYYNIFRMKDKYGFKRGYTPSQKELKRLEIMIPIPQDYNEQYKSIDIQKAIVEFLEFWKINYTDIFRHTVSHQKPIIEKIKKALISATLRYDKTMVHSFNEFASNKGFNLKLDEIKFENSTLGDIIDLIGGDRITKKNNSGTIYPVYGGGDVSFRTDTYNRENEYVIGRFAISETCVRFVNKKFHLLDSGFTFKIKNHLEEILDKNFIGYFLLSIQHKIYVCAKGSGQKNLDTNLFNKIGFSFPKDQNIQFLLVEFWEIILNNIDERFAKFDNIERLTDKVDEAFLYRTFSRVEWREK